MSKHLVRVDEELGVADNYIDREEDGSDLDLKRRYSRAPHGVQRPADHPGAVGAVVRFEREAGEITFVRSYFN